VFRGKAGTFSWTNVQIQIPHSVVRWSATAGTVACSFYWTLSGNASASGTRKVAALATGTDQTTLNGTSGPDQLAVDTTCRTWLLTFNTK
jgi:hypothetical protein